MRVRSKSQGIGSRWETGSVTNLYVEVDVCKNILILDVLQLTLPAVDSHNADSIGELLTPVH